MISVSVLLAFLGFLGVVTSLPKVDGVHAAWIVPVLDGIFIAFVLWLLTMRKVSVKVFIASALIVILGSLVLTGIAIAVILTAISVNHGR